MTTTNMIVLRPKKVFLLLAFVFGILGSTIFVVNAKSGKGGIREMVEAKCNRESDSDSKKRQLALKAGISFARSGGELGDVVDDDDDDDRIRGTIWRYIGRSSSVGSMQMQMSVSVVSYLPQRSSSGEDPPAAALCDYLDHELQGFQLIECRGYMVAGFMNICGGDSILEMIESRNDVAGISANRMMGGLADDDINTNDDDDGFGNDDDDWDDDDNYSYGPPRPINPPPSPLPSPGPTPPPSPLPTPGPTPPPSPPPTHGPTPPPSPPPTPGPTPPPSPLPSPGPTFPSPVVPTAATPNLPTNPPTFFNFDQSRTTTTAGPTQSPSRSSTNLRATTATTATPTNPPTTNGDGDEYVCPSEW
eukprot:CAMPEP_0171028430 /NCGR_PEP_ID=MMETSP0736-20130129/35728_1 /TAXON_ID=186038 /ORGANISM="Fragilariopsis kerguelensis, Strain L26-C5" /LENGTH=360 /DNA_ID=CAMNT_0011469865 /DNA_START=119 /DNA_END=1198 /DNA_ORIENTATION=+